MITADDSSIASLRLPARAILPFNACKFDEDDNNNNANTSKAVLGDLSNNFEDINKFRVKTRRIRLFNKFKT